MNTVFTIRAEAQIDALHAYLSTQANEEVADRYIARIIAFCTGLVTFPMRGTPREDVIAGLRVAGFERRVLVAYIVEPDSLIIEGIFYGGRDFERNLNG